MSQVKVLMDLHPQHPDETLFAKLHQFAEQQSLEVTLMICDYRSSIASNLMLQPDSLEKAIAHLKREHIKRLNLLAEKYEHKNISYVCEAQWHKPYYEAILKRADELNVDWIIKSANPRQGIQRWLFTPSDYQLLKSCPQPLLLSKGQPWQDSQCILAAVDPSHAESQSSKLDSHVIRHAQALAVALNLPLKVCHAFDPIGWEVVMNSTASAGVMGQFVVLDTPDDHQQLLENLRTNHREQLTELQKKHQLDDQQMLFLEGDPVETLIKACEEHKAAAIVVGTTYRSGLLGSTAESLLDQTACDLVAVKHRNFNALDTH